VKPFMVHATFQNAGLPGKISRFKENDMWRINDGEYYAGTFLTYTSHVLVRTYTCYPHCQLMRDLPNLYLAQLSSLGRGGTPPLPISSACPAP
jgi:hypothetical protein